MSLTNHTESQEMYLKTIYALKKNSAYIKAVDVGAELGYAKSSVSRALKLLEQDGYIVRKKDNVIEFTEKGIHTAEYLNERYSVVVRLFLRMGLTEEEAAKTGCEIEHTISEPIYVKLRDHLNRLEKS